MVSFVAHGAFKVYRRPVEGLFLLSPAQPAANQRRSVGPSRARAKKSDFNRPLYPIPAPLIGPPWLV